MPKFPKAFARRKSTANAIEDMVDASPVESSFKVFERPDATGTSRSFDGGVKFVKAATVPAGRPKPSQLDDNMFENIGKNRGSGASNTNTASTTDNSSRLSAASTAPSSTDIPRREEWRSGHDKSFGDVPIPPIPKSTFSLKNAGKTLSWGRSKASTSPTPRDNPKDHTKNNSKDLPSIPVDEEKYTGRSRTVTSSSYASTATPPKLDEKDLGLSLGGDFSEMFSGFGKRKSTVLDADNRAMSHSPETLPSGPANRNRIGQPSPLNIDRARGEVEKSPYSWSSQNSHDRLMSNGSPPTPRYDSPPPVPQHGQPRTNERSPTINRSERPGAITDNGLRRSSALAARRQSTLEYGDSVDEDARLLRESVNASRRMKDPNYSSKVRDSWALSSTTSQNVDDAAISSWREVSDQTTPRAKKPAPKPNMDADENNMFESHIAAAANLAERFNEKSQSPPAKPAAQNKVMTPAQFERYKQDQERLRSFGGLSKDDDEEDEEETYDDDEDEAEKIKQLAKQRRKQEAHMSVYRQQMMKVTGEAAPPVGPLRAGVYATQSSPNLLEGSKPEEGEEEDEEIPLAILQAHGFPNKNKPPMRSMGSNPNLRASVAHTVVGVGADGRLPVFARNLPQDPYFGAGLQNPMHRESLAFGSGAGSVTGAPARALPVGGLVGVIATEERSRAMRRGSPNPQGEYGPPIPNAMGISPNMRGSTTGSMYNGMAPGGMGPMGQLNPMMITPGDQAQMQMSQQMQQFMAMQMQFMQMMTSGQGPPPSQNGMTPQQGDMPRPSSSQHLRPGSAQPQQRAMTMTDPNSAPWMQQGGMFAPSIHVQGGYAPSIAPSERSNIGLPGRYRPVSHVPVKNGDKSRTSTMTGAIRGWDTKNSTSTIRPIKKSGNLSEEDDEEGWEEMAKKKREKKSMWRTKRDTNGFKDMLNFGQ